MSERRSVMRFRRLLHLDWLCQGCFRCGSHRWLNRHPCPERDELMRLVRKQWKGGFYTLDSASLSPPSTNEEGDAP